MDPSEAAIGPGPRGRLAVERLTIVTVEDMLRDQDRAFADAIKPQTLLVADLDFKSLDVVMLIGTLNRELNLIDIPFEKLLVANGRPVSDLSVQAVADFLWRQLPAGGEPALATQPR